MSSLSKDRAYNHLRARLLSGDLPRERQVSERALSKELGMSTIPVREAMNQLVGEGLLRKEPGVGTFVAFGGRKQLEELFDLREALEGFAAGRAATTLSHAQLEELESYFERMHRLVRVLKQANWVMPSIEFDEHLLSLDAAFHQVLLNAAENAKLLQIVKDFHILSRSFYVGHDHRAADHARRTSITVLCHWRILRAVKRRDAGAARDAMAAHVRVARRYALIRFDWKESQTRAALPAVAKTPRR